MLIGIKTIQMSIIITNKEQQASGNFNGGEILENKPIGFPTGWR